MNPWIEKWIPDTLFGGLVSRSVDDALETCEEELDRMVDSGEHIAGTSIDVSKCFDRLDPFETIELMTMMGLPKCVADLLMQLY